MNSSVKEIIKNRRKTEDSLKKLEHRRFERMIQSQGTKNHSLICSSNKRLIVNGKIIKPLENNENLWDIEINENDGEPNIKCYLLKNFSLLNNF